MKNINQEVKMIVAGSRNFTDYELLKSEIRKAVTKCGVTTIVSGGAAGADKLGEKAAQELNLKLEVYPALWSRDGRGAGYRRNERMALIGNILLAFWDGSSKGTAHMISVFKRGPKKVIRFDPATQPTVSTAKPQMFYAVIRGRIPGVYQGWAAAKAQLDGFPNHFNRKFDTEEEAKAFFDKETKPKEIKSVYVPAPEGYVVVAESIRQQLAEEIPYDELVEELDILDNMEPIVPKKVPFDVVISSGIKKGVAWWKYTTNGVTKEGGMVEKDGVALSTLAVEMTAIMHAIKDLRDKASTIVIHHKNAHAASLLSGGKPGSVASKKYVHWMKLQTVPVEFVLNGKEMK